MHGDILRLIPSYKEVVFVIAANAIVTLNRVGDVLSFITVTGGPYVMTIDEGEESDVRAGITYKMPAGAQFKRVVLRDKGGVGGSVVIAVARGDIYDARASISGSAFDIKNAVPPDNILHCDLPAADPGLVALLAGLVANQADSKLKREPLKTLVGATYRVGNSATDSAGTTIVTGAANANGIIVRRAATVTVDPAGTDDNYYAAGAGNLFCGHTQVPGDSGAVLSDSIENLFIPSGVALICKLDATSGQSFIWYEVL